MIGFVGYSMRISLSKRREWSRFPYRSGKVQVLHFPTEVFQPDRDGCGAATGGGRCAS